MADRVKPEEVLERTATIVALGIEDMIQRIDMPADPFHRQCAVVDYVMGYLDYDGTYRYIPSSWLSRIKTSKQSALMFFTERRYAIAKKLNQSKGGV